MSSIDIAPTIYAAVGAPAPKGLPGTNLLDVLAGKAKLPEAVQGEIFDHDVADVDDPDKSLLFRWRRQDNWKVIVPQAADAPVELYNLAEDPWETRNLAAEQPAIVTRLVGALDAWHPAPKPAVSSAPSR